MKSKVLPMSLINHYRILMKFFSGQVAVVKNIITIEREIIIKTLKIGYVMDEVPAYEYIRKYGESTACHSVSRAEDSKKHWWIYQCHENGLGIFTTFYKNISIIL